MEVSMLDSAWHALTLMMELHRLAYLAAGVMVGLVMGILPGVGGVAGLALLLPFTFGMDAYSAFAFMLGLGSVTSTGDTIPAVLFGVPGTSASQATVIDGHAMARKGEAGRALAAAYMASLMGGLFGALLLGLTIPILRPVMLYIGSPELLAFAVFGISMVAVLSGSTPLRGLAAAGIGVMLSMIGSDPQSGELRWTMGTLYLYDGLPLLPVALGLFALPELCDVAIRRAAIADESKYDIKTGMIAGAKDAFRNWWLVLRCGSLGAAIGAIPGLGSAVVDWFAYGHAVRTVKGASETFGTGDVRGVIAPESANNAKEGGSLVPTVAFGVPGSASMALLLGAFIIHGLVPGPRMLTENLDVTYSMVWSIALANVLGAGLCFAFSGPFSRLATLRYTLILPGIMSIMYVGAFQGSRDWGDLYTLLAFGVVGWTMKRMRWPRPPLILGFVLGAIIERYLFISLARYDWAFLERPVVIVLLAMAVIGMLRPLLREFVEARRAGETTLRFGAPKPAWTDILPFGLMVLVVVMLMQLYRWDEDARIAPEIVGWLTLVVLGTSLLNGILRRGAPPAPGKPARKGVHMDLVAENDDLTPGIVMMRAAMFFGWLVAFMASMATIGLIPSAALFVLAYMRLENREPWRIVIPYALGITVFVYIVFDRFLSIPWPDTVLGTLVPALTAIPSI